MPDHRIGRVSQRACRVFSRYPRTRVTFETYSMLPECLKGYFPYCDAWFLLVPQYSRLPRLCVTNARLMTCLLFSMDTCLTKSARATCNIHAQVRSLDRVFNVSRATSSTNIASSIMTNSTMGLNPSYGYWGSSITGVPIRARDSNPNYGLYI